MRVTTLSLPDAADFLKLHPDSLRKMAKSGKVPGRKIGKAWIFLLEDLVVWVRGMCSTPAGTARGGAKWASEREERLGGSISSPHRESALDARLRRKTEGRPKSTTTA